MIASPLRSHEAEATGRHLIAMTTKTLIDEQYASAPPNRGATVLEHTR